MIRDNFLNMALFLKQEAAASGYKPGWIWHQLQNCFTGFYREEIEALQQVLGYKRGWVFFQTRNLVSEGRLLDNCQSAPQQSPLDWAYQILNVAPPITREKVKQAYRTLAKRVHPDAGGDVVQFRQLQQAYEVALEVANA